MPKKPTDSALILAIAAGASTAQAAEAAGVSERTARRRAANPAVRAEIAAATVAARARAVAVVASAAHEAATSLCGLLASKNDAARLGAARAILAAARHDQLADVEQRITNLEKTVNELPSTTRCA